MTEDEVRSRAFAMPLTSPSFPLGPYRFVDREFLIITYRTDPAGAARGGPGAARVHRAGGEVRVHPHARFHRLRRLHRKRPGDPGQLPGPARRLRARDVPRRRVRRSPAGASCGAFRRSYAAPRLQHREGHAGSACSTYGPVRGGGGDAWATSTARSTPTPVAGVAAGAELPAEDHSARRRHAAHLRAGELLLRGHHAEGRLDRPGCAGAVPPRAGAGGQPAGAARWCRRCTSSPT